MAFWWTGPLEKRSRKKPNFIPDQNPDKVIGTNALKIMCSKLASRTKFIAKICKEDSGM